MDSCYLASLERMFGDNHVNYKTTMTNNTKEKQVLIKAKEDLMSYINFVYDCYCMESDKNLDKEAKRLKRCYKYVINDLKNHDCIEIE